MKHWLDKSYRGILLDFHTPEFLTEAIVNFDPDLWAENLKIAKVQYVNVCAKCHYGNSYYNTEVGHKHSGLKVDMLGELVPRLKRTDISVIAYYSANTDLRAALEHPDWEQVDVEGRSLTTSDRWHDVCFNSPYLEQLMLPQIHELVENYEIAGLWLDMVRVMPGGCFCSYCRRLFEQRYGREMSAEDEKFDEFRQGTLIKAMAKIRELVKSIRSEVSITANGAGTIADHEGLVTLSRRRGKGLVDYSAIEAAPGYGNYYYLGFQSRYARRLRRPFELINSRFIKHWGDWTMKPESQLMYEGAIMLSAGGRVCFGDQIYPDGVMEPWIYKSLGRVFDYLAKRQNYVESTTSLVDTAVLFTDGIAPALRGADAICCDLNLQHDLIDEDELTELTRYRFLLIPEIGVVGPAGLESVKRFAEAGGLVLITGRAAVNNDFQSITGVEIQGEEEYSIGYLPAETLEEPAVPLLLSKRPYKIRSLTAETLIPFQLPSCEPTKERFVSHRYANPGKVSDRPAVTINTIGRGKVVYVGFDLFSTYWESNYWWLKHLVKRCLNDLQFQPLVRISCGGIVHSFLRQGSGEMYLHMICFISNMNTAGGYPPIEYFPVANNVNMTVELKSKPKAVYLEPSGHKVIYRYQKKCLRVDIDQLQLYQVLRIVL